MESWLKISLILCIFGFLKELRPTEPFATEYIIDFKNVTAEEVIHVAFPVSTYASLGALVVVLLITDWLRYKPIVCVEGFCHLLTWGILGLSSGLTSVIIVEVFYGIACAAEVAYSTYIYAQVRKDYYKKVTSQIASSKLAGKFLGGVIAQLLITTGLFNYHQLNYITVTCVGIGAFVTLFLPSVKENKQFYLKSSSQNSPLKKSSSSKDKNGSSSFKVKVLALIRVLLKDLRNAYGDGYVLIWSLWWALASAGQYQVVNYVQALWEKIREDEGADTDLYNGAVKAIHTSLSALLTYGIGHASINWMVWGEATLIAISVVQGVMLMWMASTNSLYLAYLSYVVFRTIHPVMVSTASAEVATRIPKDSYGLIFGLNTFLALSLQTVLTLVVSDHQGLALDERSQFVVYGICFVVLGLLIGATSIFTCARNRCCPGQRPEADDDEDDEKNGASNSEKVPRFDISSSEDNEKTEFIVCSHSSGADRADFEISTDGDNANESLAKAKGNSE